MIDFACAFAIVIVVVAYCSNPIIRIIKAIKEK